MQLPRPLDAQTAALLGATHVQRITHEDLTETTAATAQTLTPIVVANKMGFILVRAKLVEPFEDTTDSANNTNTIIVGDGGSTNRFLTSMQVNANGTPVYEKGGVFAAEYVYTTDDTVDAIFGAPAAGKTLAALNKGIIDLYFKICDGRIQP